MSKFRQVSPTILKIIDKIFHILQIDERGNQYGQIINDISSSLDAIHNLINAQLNVVHDQLHLFYSEPRTIKGVQVGKILLQTTVKLRYLFQQSELVHFIFILSFLNEEIWTSCQTVTDNECNFNEETKSSKHFTHCQVNCDEDKKSITEQFYSLQNIVYFKRIIQAFREEQRNINLTIKMREYIFTIDKTDKDNIADLLKISKGAGSCPEFQNNISWYQLPLFEGIHQFLHHQLTNLGPEQYLYQLKKLLDLDPKDIFFLNNYAYGLAEQQLYFQAYHYYKQSLMIQKNQANIRVELTKILILLKTRYHEAVDLMAPLLKKPIKPIIKDYKAYGEYLCQMGNINLLEGEYEKANENFQKSINILLPYFIKATSKREEIRSRGELISSALCQQNFFLNYSMIGMGINYLKKGMFQESIMYLNRSIHEVGKRFIQALIFICRTYLKLNKKEQAETYANQIIDQMYGRGTSRLLQIFCSFYQFLIQLQQSQILKGQRKLKLVQILVYIENRQRQLFFKCLHQGQKFYEQNNFKMALMAFEYISGQKYYQQTMQNMDKIWLYIIQCSLKLESYNNLTHEAIIKLCQHQYYSDYSKILIFLFNFNINVNKIDILKVKQVYRLLFKKIDLNYKLREYQQQFIQEIVKFQLKQEAIDIINRMQQRQLQLHLLIFFLLLFTKQYQQAYFILVNNLIIKTHGQICLLLKFIKQLQLDSNAKNMVIGVKILNLRRTELLAIDFVNCYNNQSLILWGIETICNLEQKITFFERINGINRTTQYQQKIIQLYKKTNNTQKICENMKKMVQNLTQDLNYIDQTKNKQKYVEYHKRICLISSQLIQLYGKLKQSKLKEEFRSSNLLTLRQLSYQYHCTDISIIEQLVLLQNQKGTSQSFLKGINYFLAISPSSQIAHALMQTYANQQQSSAVQGQKILQYIFINLLNEQNKHNPKIFFFLCFYLQFFNQLITFLKNVVEILLATSKKQHFSFFNLINKLRIDTKKSLKGYKGNSTPFKNRLSLYYIIICQEIVKRILLGRKDLNLFEELKYVMRQFNEDCSLETQYQYFIEDIYKLNDHNCCLIVNYLHYDIENQPAKEIYSKNHHLAALFKQNILIKVQLLQMLLVNNKNIHEMYFHMINVIHKQCKQVYFELLKNIETNLTRQRCQKKVQEQQQNIFPFLQFSQLYLLDSLVKDKIFDKIKMLYKRKTNLDQLKELINTFF